MKNRQKMIIWLMLVALLLSEITHLVSISNQVVWAQEESEMLKSAEKKEKTTSTEISVNQIQSEETTETSQIQAQISSQQEENEVLSKTQTSTEETVTESSTKEEASQTSKTSIQPQAGNVDDNPGAKVAYGKAVEYWLKEIHSRLKAAPKLGNYTGATSILEFELPVENAPVTSATSGMYKWDYATSIYFENMSFMGGDGITFTGSASVSSKNGKQFNNFYLVIKRTKPGSNITIPSISLRYHGELRADQYSKSPFNGEYIWNRVDYFEGGSTSVGMGGVVWNLESVNMPSKYSWFYDEWRKISVQKIASNLSDALKSNYSKLGKNVNDTVNFTVESKASERYTGQINFIGDYFSDLSQFKVDLSSNFSAYVQLEKTGSTGTKINYRMKRVKAGNFSGDCSVTITTRHDAEGRTISIYDGSLFYWALPMDNIPLDSVSASFNINDDRQIWADVVEQTIELGTWSGGIPDVSKMFTNVRLEDGAAIDSSDYTAEITTVPSFDNMMVTDKIGVKITRKSNGAVTYLQVPVKMSWGNTIQLRGIVKTVAGAYTLHKIGNEYQIRSSYGENNKYYPSGVHGSYAGTPYHSITLLRGSGRIDQLGGTYYKETNGDVTAKEVVENFGTNGQQSVQLGDVVKIWHKEQLLNSYTKDEKEIYYSTKREDTTYFAVTADGFAPYRLNQLKPIEQTIFMGTTDEELDQKQEEMIDFLGMNGNGLKVSGISQYPNRSKPGKSTGEVVVEETIAGATYTYGYEVTFNVVSDLNVTANQLEDIPLGSNISSNPKDYVTVVSAPEDQDKLTFEWVGDPISSEKIGEYQATVRVTSPTYKVSKDITIKYKVAVPELILTSKLKVANLSRNDGETIVGDELLYVYTLTNDSPVGALASGNLTIEIPKGLEAVTRSELSIPLTELAIGKTFTYELVVKVTEEALNQNPVLKVTGQASNESGIEQSIPEATVSVPGNIVGEVDTSEINITIPTKMNFGSDEDRIISPVYKMENNSTVPVEVMVDEFTPDQKLKGKNLQLNVVSEKESVTLYENDQGFNRMQTLLTLGSTEIKQISFNGSVNKQTEVGKSSSMLRLKFKTIK